MFMVVGKQPKWSSTDEWIKKMYVYSVEYYSAIKKWNFAICKISRIDLEGIMLGERSQTKTNIAWYHLHVESKKY